MSGDSLAEQTQQTEPRELLSTGLISFFLGSVAGFLWIGRGRLALLLLAVGIVLVPLVLWRAYAGDVWVGWLMALIMQSWWLRLVGGLTALAIVLPLRKTSQPSRWYARGFGAVLAIGGAFALSLGAALFVRSFVVQPFSIPASSMEPTLMVGDYVFTDKRAYGYGPFSVPFGPWSFFDGERNQPARGDVVVFRFPPNPDVDYVKRVLGLPGDRIQVIAGAVNINGSPLRLEQAQAPPQVAGQQDSNATFQREFLPEGRSYIVENLTDGSTGDDTAEFVVPDGHYFMMGDNRDNSADSRFNVGMVPEANLVGRVDVIFWNSEGVAYHDRRDEIGRAHV